MFISILWFILFILFFLVLPSKLILENLNIKGINDPIINLGIDLIFGIIFLVLLMIIIRFFWFPISMVWLLIIPSLIYLYRQKEKLNNFLKFKFDLKSYKSIIIFFVISIGIVGQCLALFFGGWQTKYGLVFPSIHDNMWNIAITNELFYHFPPENPAISGENLKNHHYFYMLFLSLAHYVTKVDVFDLYYRWGPILISLVYGISIYAVSSIFTKKIWVRGLTVFLGYFSGNFAYLTPLFLGSNFDWKGNTFFMDQPFDQIFNPYSVLGFALVLFSIYALYQATVTKRKLDFGWSVIAGMVIGSLYGFKSFGGLIAFLALGLTAIFFLIKDKDSRLMKIMFFSLTFFIPIFFLITKLKEANLYWFPGWVLTEMMVGQDKLNLPIYAEIEGYYRSIGNTLGLFKIKFAELFIYIVGNLGTRLLGLVYLIKYFRQKNLYSAYVYMIFVIIVSFSVPLLFNLGSNAHNIVQFSPYALVLLSIFTGTALGELYYFFDKKRHQKIGFFIILIVLILSIPVNIKNILGKLALPKDIISFGQIEAFNYLKNNTDSQDLLIINPKLFDKDPIYVTALSRKKIYLASPGYARQTGENPDERIKNIDKLYYESADMNFLKDNGISYILLLKKSNYIFSDSPLMKGLKEGKFEPFFENSEVLILKVI